MKRFLALVVIFIWSALSTSTSIHGQDVIDYFDPNSKSEKKIEQIRGAIESENPAGIRVKLARSESVINVPADNIRYIRYKSAAIPELDYRRPFSLENRAATQTREDQRKKLLAEALQSYEEILPNLKDAPLASRYFQFKIAEVLARQVEWDETRLDPAIAAYTAFSKEYADSWEIGAVLRHLAHLHEVKGDLASASQVYAELAKMPGIAPQIRQENEILSARLLIRTAHYADAEKKLTALEGTLPANEPRKAAVEVYLASCRLEQGDLAEVEARVKTALAGTDDVAVQAAGHNVLGDFYLKKGQAENAFWEYLRVEVQYSQDAEEEAKALYYLTRLFDKVKNDKVRAGECLTRLQDKSRFGSTTYYRKVIAEKP